MQSKATGMSYGGRQAGGSQPSAINKKKKCKCGGECCKNGAEYPVLENGEPDFAKMSNAEKIEYQRQRRKEIWG
jgi:hypothetical protein